MHREFLISFIFILALLTACLPDPPVEAPALPSSIPVQRSSTPSPSPSPTSSITSLSPSHTPAPAATSTPAVTPTATVLVTVQPGAIGVPVLLYHHIAAGAEGQEAYFVTPDTFRQQMVRLRDWGYSPILISEAVDLLHNGGLLPLRPIIITFDDGDLDVYQNAYPILKELGFRAVFYMVVRSIDAPGQVSLSMLQEFSASGWEIGSHSYTHPDLNKSQDLQKEVCESRLQLEKMIHLPVLTFAYPYGLADDYVKHYVRDCGYTSGAGLGPAVNNSLQDIFYYPRLPVEGKWTLDEFSAHLPWKSP